MVVGTPGRGEHSPRGRSRPDLSLTSAGPGPAPRPSGMVPRRDGDLRLMFSPHSADRPHSWTPVASRQGSAHMQAFIARQPIFDLHQRVYAYELLFRSGPENACTCPDLDRASAKVLMDSLLVFGLGNLVGRARDLLQGVAADDLRTNGDMRMRVRQGMAALASDLDGMLIKSGGRKMRLAEEEPV